ncbi:MAG: DegT/DnrJ/EryC1/StrS family aminotransferase [Fimbriimonadaceae bacterium]|nr:DegT/DnrJ/EryC1/StrS family aminotransferase [Fimbriimonadaceae bacterium]
MRVPFLDLPAQYAEARHLIDPAFQEILEKGAYVLGQWNQKLETDMAAAHGVKHAIALNSGTDALRIGMQACDIGPGDEVITTAFSFVATIETVVQLGAIPVMVDILEDTFDIDPSLIEAAITPNTKAILPIHLFGQLAAMDQIMEIANRHGLIVLEDAAQAVVTKQNGKYAGQFGKCAGISFYVTKNLGAAGDGGLLLTDDDEVARRAKSLRVHGMGRERYYYDEVGYTSRMAELQAAFLHAKFQFLNQWNARRAEIAEIYQAGFAKAEFGIPVIRKGNESTWHQYTIRHPKREGLMAHLKENGIDSAIYYPVPLHLHEPYAHYGSGAGSLPVTERVSEQCVSLPVGHHLTDEQAHHVVKTVLAFD